MVRNPGVRVSCAPFTAFWYVTRQHGAYAGASASIYLDAMEVADGLWIDCGRILRSISAVSPARGERSSSGMRVVLRSLFLILIR